MAELISDLLSKPMSITSSTDKTTNNTEVRRVKGENNKFITEIDLRTENLPNYYGKRAYLPARVQNISLPTIFIQSSMYARFWHQTMIIRIRRISLLETHRSADTNAIKALRTRSRSFCWYIDRFRIMPGSVSLLTPLDHIKTEN